MMIRLVQPPAHGIVSGGYRYNEEITTRLRADGLGEAIDCPQDRLGSMLNELARASSPEIVILDSLYINSDLDASVASELERFSGRCYFLLHWLPSMNPDAEPSSRVRAKERERAWLLSVGRLLVTSPFMADQVERGFSLNGEIRIVPPGLGPEFLRSFQDRHRPLSPVKLVSVGAVIRAKNQLGLLKFLAEPAVSPFEWMILGDLGRESDYVDALVRFADASGLNVRIRLSGAVPSAEVAKQMEGAHLYISGSRFASYGMAILDAIACGLPVLGFQVGNAREWVENGRNGYLFELDDSPGFSRRLRRVLADPEELEKLIAGAGQLADKARIPTWRDTYELFLKAVHSNSRR